MLKGIVLKTNETDMIEVWDNFRQGDNNAFSLLFESYLDTLYRYGMKFIHDEDFVKDCVQDLFIKLYNNRSSLSSTTNPKFYLLYSLKNMIIDALAKNKRIIYTSPENLPFIASLYYDTEENNSYEEEIKEKFEKVLGMLNARQKEAIYLKFQMGLSYEEISQLLQINYQSARNLIHRSITKIRSIMDLPVFLIHFAYYYV